MEEIIERSGTSRGSFYHYFDGKDALLSSLSYLFDEEYARLQTELDPELDSWEKLLRLNAALFTMIENRISLELLTRLLSSQLVTRGDKHLLNRERLYFKYLRQIVRDLIESGELPPQERKYSIYGKSDVGSFKFIFLHKAVPSKSELSFTDELVLNT